MFNLIFIPLSFVNTNLNTNLIKINLSNQLKRYLAVIEIKSLEHLNT